jgi:hypothetical protein
MTNTLRSILIFIIFAICNTGCQHASSPTPEEPTPGLASYAFPTTIEAQAHYMFYLHGKIIEDQGLPAIDPTYGGYEYGAILKTLSSYGFVVISEQRSANTDIQAYATRVEGQIGSLLNAGVPAGNITVVGASKGAWITVLISHDMHNSEINYVLIAICAPENVDEMIRDGKSLSGNVLSLYDSVDPYGGSCQRLFDYSEGKGLGQASEIVLHVGTGHGILYKPLDEWVLPVVDWAIGTGQ